MRILLISPNTKGMEGGVNRIQPPLGIALLASRLRQGNEIFIYDSAIEGWENRETMSGNLINIGHTREEMAKVIESIQPDVVGISVLFSNLMDNALKLAEICKKIRTNTLVLLGGNYITNVIKDWYLGFRNLSPNKDVDYYFSGEGEDFFPDFINRMGNGTEANSNGLSYFRNGNLISNPPVKFFDMSQCPFPSWDLFPMEKYFSVGLFHSAQSYSSRVLPVMASRGCPEKCSFCSTPAMWGNKVRWNDPSRIIAEIGHFIEKYNIGEIQFQDDTLTANFEKFNQLCNGMRQFHLPWCTPNGIKINYHRQNHETMFRRMKESGCYQVTLACESGVQRVLDDIIHKNIQVSQFQTTIQKAKDAGLFVHTFWIVGFPGETRPEIERTVEVASQSGADTFSLAIFTPLPGTPLYHKIVRENLWWNSKIDLSNSLFRNSMVKVDGFDSPIEFENWVDKQSVKLNSVLEKNNPLRHQCVIKGRGAKASNRKIKQT